MEKQCVLRDDEFCVECGQCNICDLDPDKLCDNCMRCVKSYHADYVAIEIDEVYNQEAPPDGAGG